jgi:hypothetical protein
VLKILATVKAEEAFAPLSASVCPMVTAKK